MVAAPDLGSGDVSRGGSSPFTRTNFCSSLIIMKRILLILFGLGIFLIISCNKYRDALTDKSFEGNYYSIEGITITFNPNSKVKARIYGLEVVGGFNMEVYGHYRYRHPYVDIVWEKMDNNGWHRCKELKHSPDSVLINDSINKMSLFEDGKCYLLSHSQDNSSISWNTILFITVDGCVLLSLLLWGIIHVIRKKRIAKKKSFSPHLKR